ncbi:VWA domain-containing protein [Leucobacter insecticola]|uniref:VWA domain-containing protein n=1 Tax=Leucobacter insecticola TaxID=2714934 RepID=A0A6G8FJR7_9MICO|nr:vWA domain-containing protein [Leucobacter insecticola]QIM16615.1 VWA domain-containing protein [Leucobacter insecticola]
MIPSADPLHERLRAASAIVGVPITVTDDAEWRITDGGIQVGFGYYAAGGHGDHEAVALALLQLWEGARFPQTGPDRARRRESILQKEPALEPLLDAILRLQAAAELLTALPALRDDLAAAATRSLPEMLEELPRHLQWVALLLWVGLARRNRLAAAPEVIAEWQTLAALGSERTDPLRHVLAPDPARTPLQRFERALALLLPAYTRLMALDRADRGLAHTGDESDGEAASAGAEGLGGSDGGDAEEPQQGEGEATAGTAAEAPDPASDRARRGEGQDRAEGSDLFAAEQAGFVTAFLSTPMPVQTALLEANVELSIDARADAAAEASAPTGGSAGTAQSARATADYRTRAAELAAAIAQMRDVWAEVVTERIAYRAAFDRLPHEEGDALHPEALASVIAEVNAGTPNPRAFVKRRARPRRTRRSGSTDYVLLIDRSASMQGAAAAAAADAALIMLEALAGAERDVRFAEVTSGISLDLDIRTSLIVFDAVAETVKPLSRGLDDTVRQRMVAAIQSPRGSTNDAAALSEAASQLGLGGDRGSVDPLVSDGLERRRIVIFVGDGGSNDPVAAAAQLRRLHAAGVHVYGIGIRSDDIVQRFAPRSHRVDDPRDLPSALQELIERERVA